MTNYEISRSNQLIKTYGITLQDYADLMSKQDGKCAICRQPALGGHTSTRSLHVDHNHKTGKVRGLLCHKCNPALGQFNESIERVSAALEYLKAYETQK